MEKEIDFNTGIYNPYTLAWGEEIEFPTTRTLLEYGNRVYNRYPARSIFLVPRSILAQHVDKKLNVLDPFMGSGTTAVETILSGNIPYGIEMDPFARLIAEVSSTTFNEDELKELSQLYKDICINYEFSKSDEIPDLQGIERWFKPTDLTDLLKLKNYINKIENKKFKSFMLIAFADAIKPVSLMERQSLKPYISKKYPKQTKTVRESFEYSFNAHYSAISGMSSYKTGVNGIKWIGFDASKFTRPDVAIDIAITSPPYINALDYTRCVKIEGALCGCINNAIAKDMRKVQIGHENRKNTIINKMVEDLFEPYFEHIKVYDIGRAKTCLAYFNDMYNNLSCVYNVLRMGGEYHIIIGDNTIKKVKIPTHEIIAAMATKIGFKWFGYYKYKIKDHRTSIPRGQSHQKIEYEYVLMLKK